VRRARTFAAKEPAHEIEDRPPHPWALAAALATSPSDARDGLAPTVIGSLSGRAA
jgi:hypothetical protein